jgi:acylphosphatase
VAARSDYGKSAGRSNQKDKSLTASPKNIASRARLWLHPAMPQPVQPAARRRKTVFFSGRVQGVGFRYTAKTVATGFEITGTIRNLPDGRVELVAEGSHAELEAFRAALHDAGLAGFIRDEQVIWGDAKNEFRGFEIVR